MRTEKVISKGKKFLGKLDRNGGKTGTRNCAAYLTWDLNEGENGIEFSMSGEVWNRIKTDCIMGGQCCDELGRLFSHVPRVSRMVEIWNKYHLNGMNAGTPEQIKALEEEKQKVVDRALGLPNPERFFYNLERRELNLHIIGTAAGLKESDYYSWCCHVLKERGLYRVRIPADTELRMTGGWDRLPKSDYQAAGAGWFYDYGHGWIFNPIPAAVIEEIKGWSAVPEAVGT